MNMKNLLSLLLLFACGILLGQDREAAIWHFGQFAGLDFNSLVPVSRDLARINTNEGSATISDKDGNLLFYSDGVTVYDNTHAEMPNGTDLLGSTFSTQSALIVPDPTLEDYYYLFTASDIRQANLVLAEGDGINYYRVNLRSGPGTVFDRVNHLVTYDPDNRTRRLLKSSQKLTAVKAPDEEIYWVLAHFEDTFYAYKIDETGISVNPVKSQVGPVQFLGGYARNSKGQMKLSPDGTKLAAAFFQNNFGPESFAPGSLYLFDFDIQSGVVSNAREMLETDYIMAYGVEFSPDSKKLYSSLSSYRYNELPVTRGPLLGSSLFQIDLEDNYRARRISYNNEQPMALQLAIDGKIYKAHEGLRALGVINNPKIVGKDANYADMGLTIGRTSQKGLPGFVQSYFQVRINFEEACEGAQTRLFTNYLPEPDNIAWDFGDGSAVQNTTEKDITHVYNSSGEFLVEATITKGSDVETYSKLVTVREIPSLTPVTISQCDEDGDGLALFNLNEPSERIHPDPTMQYSFYFTQTDAENQTNPIPRGQIGSFSNSTASRVYARGESEFGCFNVTTIDLEVSNNTIPTDFMLNYSSCDSLEDGSDTNGVAIFDFSPATEEILALFPGVDDLQVYFYPSYENAITETLEIDPTRFVNTGSPFSQKIWVRVEGSNDNTCIGLGQHLTLTVNEVPRFEVFQEEVVCQSQFPYTIEARNVPENFSYEWSDEDGNILGRERQFNAPGEGTFTVTVSKTDGTFCSTSKTVTLGSILPPVIADIEVEGIISLKSTATVTLSDFEGYEFALDDPTGPYQPSNVFNGVAPGIHKVYVRDKNQCELVDADFSVIGHPAFFTPNNDGVNDFWQIQGVSAELQAESDIYIFDRYGTLLALVDPTSKGWDGIYQGKLLPSSDYWFRVKLEDGREFNGHFALKR